MEDFSYRVQTKDLRTDFALSADSVAIPAAVRDVLLVDLGCLREEHGFNRLANRRIYIALQRLGQALVALASLGARPCA